MNQDRDLNRPDPVEEVRARRRALFEVWSRGGNLKEYSERVDRWAKEHGYTVVEPAMVPPPGTHPEERAR